MGLNNGPLDTHIINGDFNDDADNYRIEMDEDYYTTKYVRMRHRKDVHISSKRKETRPKTPPGDGKKRVKINTGLNKPDVKPISATSYGSDLSTEGVTDVKVLPPYNRPGNRMSSAGNKPMKTKHTARQLNRSRKLMDETEALSFTDKHSMYHKFRKGKCENVENEQPRLNTILQNHNRTTSKVSLSSGQVAKSSLSTIKYVMTNIGIKRNSIVKGSPVVYTPNKAITPETETEDETHVDIITSPFVQSLDPSIFKSGLVSVGGISDRCGGGVVSTAATGSGGCVGEGGLQSDKQGGRCDPIVIRESASLNDKSVTHAIFQALFGQACYTLPGTSSEHTEVEECRWDAVEEEDEDRQGNGSLDNSSCDDDSQQIPLVDEQWFVGVLRSRSNSRSDSWGSARSSSSDGSRPRSGSNSTLTADYDELTHTSQLHPRSRSNSMTLTSPLLTRSGSMFSELTPLLSSAAFEYALTVASSPPNKGESMPSSVSVVNTVASVGATQSPELSNEPQNSLLEYYITPDLITQLVLQLSHDDERVMSPRLSVLKALHKNCVSMHTTIMTALELASYNRVLRCQANTHMAKSLSIHYDKASVAVFRQHFPGEESSCEQKTSISSTGVSSAAGTSSAGSGSNGGSAGGSDNFSGGGGNGSSAGSAGGSATFRDHDGSLIELALFVAVAEFSTPPITVTEATKAVADETLNSIFGVVSNVMRCYGKHLSSAVGTVDDCVVLKGVIKIINISLGYCSELDSLASASTTTASASDTSATTTSTTAASNTVSNNAPPPPASGGGGSNGSRIGGKVINSAEQFLDQLLKHWPKGDTIRELAYWRVVSVVLPYTTLPSPSPPLSSHSTSSSASSSLSASSSSSSSVGLAPSQSLSLRMMKTLPSQRVLKKLLTAITSIHFKIALQAIQVIMQPTILLPLVITAATTTAPGPSAATASDVGESLAAEQLVAKLRENRQHWHTAVKVTSEHALDMLLDYL